MSKLTEIQSALGSQDQETRSYHSSVDLEQLAKSVGANDATVQAYADLAAALATDEEPAATRTVDSQNPGLEPGEDLAAKANILGVGLGIGSARSARLPGEPVVRIYTAEPMTTSEAVSQAIGVFGVDALSASDVAVDAVQTGIVDAYSHRARWRPTCPSGISIGHYSITAGTLGAHCTGRSGERAGRTLVLSNNHVLADVNAGSIGDDIIQQGKHDGGTVPVDTIGLLEDYIAIDFAADNYVDAATAWIEDSAIDTRFLYVSGSSPAFYNVDSTTATAYAGQQVGKSGRTTGLTAGYVSAVGVTVNVRMGSGRVARFVDQIEIIGTQGTFSRGGDSGSLIWTWDQRRNPVGLLFAGGGQSTFANPIDTVLRAMDIDLVV